jgi:hypothetical protein
MPPPATPEDEGAAPSLDDASALLESALARLEALVEAGPLQSELFRARDPDPAETPPPLAPDVSALKAELEAARARERALETAAAAASEALGRAMAEVRHALDAGSAEPDEREEAGTDEALDPAAATTEDD